MRNLRRGIVICFFAAALFLAAVYIWRYQIGGYSVSGELKSRASQPIEIIDEINALASKHGKIAITELVIQELEVSGSTITAVYSNFEKNYVLTITYKCDANRISYYINRTRKLAQPALSYSEWRYDTDYFKSMVGDFSKYKIDGVWEKDILYFSVDGISYRANLITGEMDF